MAQDHEAFSRSAREYLVSVTGVLAEKSVKNYRDALRVTQRTAEALGLEPDPRLWGEREILAIRDAYVQRYAPISLAMRFSAINNMLLFLDNPIMVLMRQRRRLRLPKPVRGFVRWQEEEAAMALISRAVGTTRMVLVLGFGMGLRREEIATLKVSGIGHGQLLVMGKGSKQRVLPLEGWVLKELQDYMNGTRRHIQRADVSDTLLIHRRNGRVQGYVPMGIYRMVRRHGRVCGIQLTVHEMRRTWAEAMRRRGVGLEIIQRWLGHESLETTRLYLTLSMSEMRDAARDVYSSYSPA